MNISHTLFDSIYLMLLEPSCCQASITPCLYLCLFFFLLSLPAFFPSDNLSLMHCLCSFLFDSILSSPPIIRPILLPYALIMENQQTPKQRDPERERSMTFFDSSAASYRHNPCITKVRPHLDVVARFEWLALLSNACFALASPFYFFSSALCPLGLARCTSLYVFSFSPFLLYSLVLCMTIITCVVF